MGEGAIAIGEGENVGLFRTVGVGVERATASDNVFVTEVTITEELGPVGGGDDRHAASIMPKQTKRNRLATSNLIITDPIRNGFTFSVQTASPQTEE